MDETQTIPQRLAALTTPLAVRLTVEANRGTPALASMIAKVLADAGATVTHCERVEIPKDATDLTGLHVHIDRLTWVRDEESQRWGKR